MVLSASNIVKPLWQNSKATCPKDDLFAAIDDYFCELYASQLMQNHLHGQTVNGKPSKKAACTSVFKVQAAFWYFYIATHRVSAA